MIENNSKAVRDLIPEIIKLSGRKCMISKLSDSDFLPELEKKLEEELKEYLDSKELEELSDLLEVIYRIAELRGSSKDELEDMRERKKQEKGGFKENLLLVNPLEESFHDRLYPVASTEFKNIVFRPEDAAVIEKHGVMMKIYTTKAESKNAAVLYQETQKGHAEEFMHEKSDFIYYILEGSGAWIVEDRVYEAQAGELCLQEKDSGLEEISNRSA